jgi:hypothetical protein
MVIWELNTEEMGYLNNIKEFISYLKRTQHFSFTMINWLMLFKEIIPVYTENHTIPKNTRWGITDC